MIRVLIVDDHALIRRGLSDLLSAAEGIDVVGSIDDGLLAAAFVTELEPDIVLMDLSMPGPGRHRGDARRASGPADSEGHHADVVQ